MSSIFKVFLFCLLGTALGSAALEGLADVRFAQLEDTTNGPVLTQTQSEALSEIEGAISASEAWLSSELPSEHLFWKFRRIASAESNPESKLSLFCSALSWLSRAIERAPHRGDYIAYWADLRQILGTYECGQFGTQGDLERVLDFIDRVDPGNPNASFISGLVYHWIGKKEKSFKELSHTISYPFALNGSRVSQIVAITEDPESLERLIPKNYPQSIQWAQNFKSLAPKKYETWAEEFSKILKASLERDYEGFQSGSLSTKDFKSRIQSYRRVEESEDLRTSLDSVEALLMARLANRPGDRIHALSSQYLAQRAQFLKLEFLSAYRLGDSRPQVGPLKSWGALNALDPGALPLAIGGFVPKNQRAELIEVKAPMDFSTPESLRLFRSKDNYHWQELSKEKYELNVISLDGQNWITFTPAPFYGGFVKILIPGRVGLKKNNDHWQLSNINLYGAKIAGGGVLDE